MYNAKNKGTMTKVSGRASSQHTTHFQKMLILNAHAIQNFSHINGTHLRYLSSPEYKCSLLKVPN